MEILRIPRITQDSCAKYRLRGRSIGFVPTMGALHEGHLSLLKRARQENDLTVVSIFLNPIQFGPAEDLEKYPKDTDEDIKKLREAEADILFMPDRSLMYPAGFSSRIEIGGLSEKLCGAFRPGHFSGVATVVAKLFNIISPTRSYFGQKDFQQTVVINRMVKDLNMETEIVACPTVRESDGLAMSSRNAYLDDRKRTAAPVIYRSLEMASSMIKAGASSVVEVRDRMRNSLAAEPMITKIDYASVYDPGTLEEAGEVKGDLLLAVAVRMGDVRLIDNMLLLS